MNTQDKHSEDLDAIRKEMGEFIEYLHHDDITFSVYSGRKPLSLSEVQAKADSWVDKKLESY